MHCYFHPDRTAVGSCKSCCRALCNLYAVDVSRGLACKNNCEEDVRQLNHLIQESVAAVSNLSTINLRTTDLLQEADRKSKESDSATIRAYWALLLVASLALIFGIWKLWSDREVGVSFILGAAPVPYGIYNIRAISQTK